MSTPRPDLAAPDLWQFPTPRVRTLDNGLAVWAFDLPGQHVITAELGLDIPLSVEPRDAEGVATIALRTSDEGTTAHPDGEVGELLEDRGAAFEGGASTSSTHASLDLPATRLAQALPLFAEIVQSPAYANADVERHVALRLAEIEQSLVSPGSVASLAVRRVLHQAETRDARPVGGNAETVAAITADDVHRFHDRWWRPEGATLVLAGELPDDVDALVDEAFGSWSGPVGRPEHRAPSWNPPVTGPDDRPTVYLVDRPGSVQTELRVVGNSVDRSSQLFPALQVAMTAMGGAFSSRLNMLLREQRGYTYGVHMGTHPGRIEGTWSMGGSFRTEVAVDALDDTLATLDISSAPLTETEVRDAINFQVGIAPLRYATAGGVAGQAISLAAAGYGAEHVNSHFAHVAAVTPQLASEAFGAIVHPERAQVVMVGDAAQLRAELERRDHRVVDLTL